MSTRRPTRTRALGATVAVTVAVLVGATGSAALADPPAGDDRTPSCSTSLGEVDDWPGTGPDGRQLFSDAYERYLLSQPACATPLG
jgi:hypothetical protein